jgi:hypothetical protein
LLTVAVTVAASLLSAQQPDFKVDVTRVGVDVSVINAEGRTVTGGTCPPEGSGGTVRRVSVRVHDVSLLVRQSRDTYQPR